MQRMTRRMRGLGGVSLLALLAGMAGCQSSGGASASRTGSAASLSARVHEVNQPLTLNSASSGSSLSTRDFQGSGNSPYSYVAAVDSPTNPASGDVLQATNFAFDATHAYVTYNMNGPATEGALDIIDLTDNTNPQLVGSLIFPAEEFADIALVGNRAVLVGASAANGGLLAVVDISDPTNPRETADVNLGSYYGTSITLTGTSAVVTTGDVGGGVVHVDLSQPDAPVVGSVTPIANALSVASLDGAVVAIGGADEGDLYAVSGSIATPLLTLGTGHFDAPVRMAAVNGRLVSNGAHSGLSVVNVAADGASASVTWHSDLDGTGNGVDSAGNLVILAQGEIGTLLYDFTTPDSPSLLGTFAFPDERGSANEVRFGSSAGNDYAFLSDGLDGLRIVQVGSEHDDAGAACSVQWWLDGIPGDWWNVPATTDDTSPGTWSSVASETSDLCRVEQFIPTADNAQCSAIQLKRAIAIGPQPNEGQKCPVTCPAGTIIANVHSRYGEASPLNDLDGGDYSCTGTTDPDSHEISCDIMSDFCDGTTLNCVVQYDNAFCGDPWYNCIKSGRTKWQCVPVSTGGQ